MKNIFHIRYKHIFLLLSFWLLGIMAFFVKIYSIYPFLIEHFYSRDHFITISEIQRKIFGRWSFNFGDFFFIIIIFVFLYFIVRIILLIWYRKYATILNIRTFYIIACIFFLNYILSTVLWGLNFKRMPIEQTMKLDTLSYYDVKTLNNFTAELVVKLNQCADSIDQNTYQTILNSFSTMGSMCSKKVNEKEIRLFKDMDSFYYHYPSIKKSMLTFMLNGIGIAGYHNPFTGEAIINTQIPNFLIPASMVHEIMHQMGFAKESETIFMTYIIATHTHEDLISYSILLDLFIQLNNILEKEDLGASLNLISQLNPLAQKHLIIYNNYIQNHNGFAKVLADQSYNFFININYKSSTSDQINLVRLLLSYSYTVKQRGMMVL